MKLKITACLLTVLCSLFVMGLYSAAQAQVKTGTVKSQKKTIAGSRNPNGEGKADLVLYPVDFPEKKIPLLALLQEKIPGFTVFPDAGNSKPFHIRAFKANLIFDGIDVDYFYSTNQLGHYGYLREYLESLTTEDILGVEVMYPGRYGQAYVNRYKDLEWQQKTFATANPTLNLKTPMRDNTEAWIEITTKGHDTEVNRVGMSSEKRKP